MSCDSINTKELLPNRENWARINGYENYEVSTFGRVWSIKRQQILKSSDNGKGYHQVQLCRKGEKNKFSIHVLVATAFCKKKDGCGCVDHIDRDRSNNHYLNLRWCTDSDNNRNKKKSKNASSKYYGVSFHKASNKWRARINVNGNPIHLGYYNTEKEAAKCFNNKVLELEENEFYNLNEISDDETDDNIEDESLKTLNYLKNKFDEHLQEYLEEKTQE